MTMKWDIQLSACSASVTLITRPWRQTRCESLQQSSPWWRARWTAEALREAPPTAPWLRVSNALWTGIGRYMQTCPLFSCLHMNSLSALKYWVKADPIRSQYWESWYGVCGWRTPSLNPLPIWISHPPSLSCLLLSSLSSLSHHHHRCHLSAPLLTLSPTSVCWIRRGSVSLHRRHAWRIPCLSLHLGLWPRGSTMAPSSLLSAGLPHLSGSALVCRRPSAASGLHSSDCTSSLQLCQASPSLQLHLAPQSLRLHCVLPDPCLRLGRRRHLPCLGPPDPRCRPGSSALRLHLGLLHHLLRRHRSAPWSRQPFLHHGSFLRRLHCGPPSWLWPGSAWLLLLQVPPVSVLAPRSVWSALAHTVSSLAPSSSFTTLDSVYRPPPGHPATSWIFSNHLFHPTSTPLSSSEVPLRYSLFLCGARSRLLGGGRSVTPQDCFSFRMCSVWPTFPSCLIVSLCSGLSSHYPHLRSPYKLHSVQCFFVQSRLYTCVCCLPVMDYPYVDY